MQLVEHHIYCHYNAVKTALEQARELRAEDHEDHELTHIIINIKKHTLTVWFGAQTKSGCIVFTLSLFFGFFICVQLSHASGQALSLRSAPGSVCVWGGGAYVSVCVGVCVVCGM